MNALVDDVANEERKHNRDSINHQHKKNGMKSAKSRFSVHKDNGLKGFIE